jgi:hypothetical protein
MGMPSIKSVFAVSSAIFLLGFSLIIPAHGQSTYFSETNKTVARLGAEGGGFYATFVESVGQTCLYGILYVASDKKGLYTQLLTAKITGKRLSRIDYSQPNGNGTVCNLELAEISE